MGCRVAAEKETQRTTHKSKSERSQTNLESVEIIRVSISLLLCALIGFRDKALRELVGDRCSSG